MDEANAHEPLLLAPPWVQPRVHLGCSLDNLLSNLPVPQHDAPWGHAYSHEQASRGSHHSKEALQAVGALAQLYAEQKHMLVWSRCRAWVVLRDGFATQDLLIALLQVC